MKTVFRHSVILVALFLAPGDIFAEDHDFQLLGPARPRIGNELDGDGGMVVLKVSNCKINEVEITGEYYYPTPQVLANLGFTDRITEEQKKWVEVQSQLQPTFGNPAAGWYPESKILEDKNILSLGEGTSGLVVFLNKNVRGAKAKGLDYAYNAEIDPKVDPGFQEMLRDYQKKYQPFLKPGNAASLPKSDTEKYDVVVAHKLLNNLDPPMGRRVIAEAFRVLRPGGTLRLTDTNRFAVSQALPEGSFDLIEFQGKVIAKRRRILPRLGAYPSDTFPIRQIMGYIRRTKAFSPHCLQTEALPLFDSEADESLILVYKKR